MSGSPAPAPAPSGCPCVRVPPISVAIAAAAAAVLLWTIARTVAASDFRFRLVVPPWSCLFGFYLPRSCLHKWAKLAFSPPWPHSWIFLLFLLFSFFFLANAFFSLLSIGPRPSCDPGKWQMHFVCVFTACLRLVSYRTLFLLFFSSSYRSHWPRPKANVLALVHTHCELKYVHAIETKKWFMQQH